MRLSFCRELNYFEHFDILEKIENDKLDLFLKKVGDFSSIKLINPKRPNLYVIIHECSKTPNSFQISYFDEEGPVSDKIFPSKEECVASAFKTYSFVENIVLNY